MTDKPTETDAPALAGSEAQKGGSELDALTGEFDALTSGKSEPKTAADVRRVLAEVKPVVEYARSNMAKEQKAQVDETIKAAISAVKGDLEIPDKVVKGWLYERSEDEGFREAFLNRAKNPSAWKAALAEASKEFSTEFKVEDTKRVASDIQAARASVAGATETKGDAPKGPSVVEKAQMSDQQWAAYKAEHYARP